MNDTLEELIDAHGLGNVLSALADVCNEKAEHVRSTWQDRELARRWSLAAKYVGNAAFQVFDLLP